MHGITKRDNPCITYSSLAQSVERSAVNRNVVGSSPTGGAMRDRAEVARNPHKVEVMGSNPIPAPRGKRALSLQSDPTNGKRSVTHRNRRC